jgi:hypothetical protein
VANLPTTDDFISIHEGLNRLGHQTWTLKTLPATFCTPTTVALGRFSSVLPRPSMARPNLAQATTAELRAGAATFQGRMTPWVPFTGVKVGLGFDADSWGLATQFHEAGRD